MATPHYRHIAALGTLLLLGLSGSAAGAEMLVNDEGSEGTRHTGDLLDFHSQRRVWTAEIEPMVWFAAFKGDLTFQDGSTVELKQVGMDEVHAAPAGRFTLRSDRWTFAFTGWATSFDDEATAEVDIDAGAFDIAAGDRVAFDFDYASFKLTAGYAFDPVVRNDDNNTALWFDLYGGAQVYHMDLEFGPDGAGDRIDESDTWVAPLVGVRMNLTLPAGFEVGVAVDAGAAIGGGTGFAWDIVPHFRWFPMENKTVAVEIGFRHNAADLATGDDEDFAFDGFAAGLFASVVIRFLSVALVARTNENRPGGGATTRADDQERNALHFRREGATVTARCMGLRSSAARRPGAGGNIPAATSAWESCDATDPRASAHARIPPSRVRLRHLLRRHRHRVTRRPDSAWILGTARPKPAPPRLAPPLDSPP